MSCQPDPVVATRYLEYLKELSNIGYLMVINKAMTAGVRRGLEGLRLPVRYIGPGYWFRVLVSRIGRHAYKGFVGDHGGFRIRRWSAVSGSSKVSCWEVGGGPQFLVCSLTLVLACRCGKWLSSRHRHRGDSSRPLLSKICG